MIFFNGNSTVVLEAIFIGCLNHIKYIHERMKLQMFRLEKDSSTKEGKRSMLSREVEDVYSFGSRYKT